MWVVRGFFCLSARAARAVRVWVLLGGNEPAANKRVGTNAPLVIGHFCPFVFFWLVVVVWREIGKGRGLKVGVVLWCGEGFVVGSPLRRV